MDIFGSPNFKRMADEHDHDGLYRLLEHRNKVTRLQAAQTLAEMNDGAGWRYLMDTVRQRADADAQLVAAAMLGELGHPRAVPVLAETLIKARFEPGSDELATSLREALQAIAGQEAEDALRRAGYMPEDQGEPDELANYDAQFIRPILPRTDQINILSAEAHLNNAVQLRESELAERGLVENSLALWLSPDWGYAWYLRGVLMEDLERVYEAWLAYRRAVSLDRSLEEAREALNEVEAENTFPELSVEALLAEINAREWQQRRDAAAGLGELALTGSPAAPGVIDALMEHLEDEEREVRYAAVEALGRFGDPSAVLPILSMGESSWLMRFAILRSLAQIGSVDGLVTVLRREMNTIHERNPVFSSHKDPLLEVEFDLLMEIGVLSLEHTGDVEGLLEFAEGNEWEEFEEQEELDEADGYAIFEEGRSFLGELSEGEPEDEFEEELTSYVDEVAEMVAAALDRLAPRLVDQLPVETLKRLSRVPDLTLIDISDETNQPVVVYDLAGLRQLAQEKLRQSGR